MLLLWAVWGQLPENCSQHLKLLNSHGTDPSEKLEINWLFSELLSLLLSPGEWRSQKERQFNYTEANGQCFTKFCGARFLPVLLGM